MCSGHVFIQLLLRRTGLTRHKAAGPVFHSKLCPSINIYSVGHPPYSLARIILRIIEVVVTFLSQFTFTSVQLWMLKRAQSHGRLRFLHGIHIKRATRAVDPDSLDPDPAFQVNPDPDPIKNPDLGF